MPERNYKAPQLSRGQTSQMQVAGPVRDSAPTPVQVQPSIVSSALQGLLKLGGQYAAAKVEASAEESYLQGARQANLQQSAESVDSDALTSPFTRGGFNMQTYRMEQAAFAEEMQEYINGDGKSDSPEEFGKVLSERAGGRFTEALAGLSMGDRVRALTAQTELERGISDAQVKAYKANSVSETAQRYTTQGNQINTSLIKARTSGDEEAYAQQAQRAALYFNDVMQGDGLPSEMRREVASSYLISLAADDHTGVIESLRNDGMLDDFDHATRDKLADALRVSKGRTLARDNLGVLEENAQFMVRNEAGDVTIHEVRAHVGRNVRLGLMSAGQGQAEYRKYYAGLSDHENMQAMQEALANSDQSTLHRMGLTTQEALDKQDAIWAKNDVPLETRVLRGMEQGMRLGVSSKTLGRHIGNAVNAIAVNPDEVNPDQVSLLNNLIVSARQLEGTNRGALNVLLNSVPEAQRNVFSYAMQMAEQGVGPDEAIKTATANDERFQAMTEAGRTRVTGELRTAVDDLIEARYGNSWGSTWDRNKIGGASNVLPNAGRWSEDQYRMQVQAEIRRLALNPDNLSLFGKDEDAVASLATRAEASVAARTIRVSAQPKDADATPLTLPNGVSVERAFGTTDSARVGQVLYNNYKAQAEDNFAGFVWNKSDGELYFTESDAEGTVLNKYRVDRNAVREEIAVHKRAVIAENTAAGFGAVHQVRQLDQAKAAGQVHLGEAIQEATGAGTSGTQTASTGDGTIGVRIDGNNTAGASRLGAYRWKQRLLDAEGLRLKAYKDGDKVAVGIGQQVDMQIGDTITIEEAETMFRDSSDKALNSGVRIASELGVTSEAATFAIAGAAYQLGEAGLRKFKKTFAAIRANDWEEFQAEAKDSKWYRQTPERVHIFIDEMKPHFNY